MACRLPPTEKPKPKYIKKGYKHRLTVEQVKILRGPLKKVELAQLARAWGITYHYAWMVMTGYLRADVL